MNICTTDSGERVREGEQMEIGGHNRYKQACARCFYADSTLMALRTGAPVRT